MSISLFEKTCTTLRDELFSQLSPSERNFISNCGNDWDRYLQFHANTGHLDRRVFAAARQIFDIRKKYVGDGAATTQQERDAVCWKKFLHANAQCRKQNDIFDARLMPGIESKQLSRLTWEVLERARVHLDNAFWMVIEDSAQFHLLDGGILYPRGDFNTGPGSTQESNGTIFDKYENLSCSSDDGVAYLQSLADKWLPLQYLLSDSKKGIGVVPCIEPSFVEKDSETSRMIVPMLSGDLVLQYPMESFANRMLVAYFKIDIQTQQEKNRAMAREGSLHDNLDLFPKWGFSSRRMRFCTADLRNASDLTGTGIYGVLFPPPMVDYCMRTSPRSLRYEGQSVRIESLANMGNAFCFPMMTLLFSAIIRGLYDVLGIPERGRQGLNYAVFGDDLVVDVAAYDSLMMVLRDLLMEPNLKKSFAYYGFKESCGGDYFEGYNIRPVFCSKLQDDGDVYSLVNRLLDWSITHSFNLSSTIDCLLRGVKRRRVIPMDENPEGGLRVPEVFLTSPHISKDWKGSVGYTIKRYRDSRDTLDDSTFSPYFRGKKHHRSCVSATLYITYDYRCYIRKDIATHRVYLGSSLFFVLRGGLKTVRERKKQRPKEVNTVVSPTNVAPGDCKVAVTERISRLEQQKVSRPFWDGQLATSPVDTWKYDRCLVFSALMQINTLVGKP